MIFKISFIIRLIVAIILIQSLYFKFSGHPEAVHIFSTLGVEPWGRIILGIFELIIGLLLLFSKTHIIASFSSLGLMLGAVGCHLFTPIGIVVVWNGKSDGGQLFIMALIAIALSAINLIIYGQLKEYSLKELIIKEVLKKS